MAGPAGAAAFAVVVGSTGAPTTSSTVGAAPSAVATAPTTAAAANGRAAPELPDADGGWSEYVLATTGTRRRTIFLAAAGAGAAFAGAGSTGGLCSFGTESEGNQGCGTRRAGSGFT